jgi:hypothetical protein
MRDEQGDDLQALVGVLGLETGDGVPPQLGLLLELADLPVEVRILRFADGEIVEPFHLQEVFLKVPIQKEARLLPCVQILRRAQAETKFVAFFRPLERVDDLDDGDLVVVEARGQRVGQRGDVLVLEEDDPADDHAVRQSEARQRLGPPIAARLNHQPCGRHAPGKPVPHLPQTTFVASLFLLVVGRAPAAR